MNKTISPISGGSSSIQKPTSFIIDVPTRPFIIDPTIELKELATEAETLENPTEVKSFIENLHGIIDTYCLEYEHKNSLMTPLCEIIINFPFGGDLLRELVELVEKLVYFGHEIPEITEDLLSKLCLNMHSSDPDSRFNFLNKLLKNNRITKEIYVRILQDIICEMCINISLNEEYKNEKLNSMKLFLDSKLKK